ncbi:MAG: hypothetical protein C4617_04300 [Candidatus Liberibacter europaeus]|uniref:Uncharacterized protein n=1 Tax=Candidatus Liberibacter europaeus TaxID=744859 RepID=A0A2T4VXD0_9HYPH|nr:hypothetical protein [Candidatus Liberibacter europaeus]PTL86425.1 MAG: hypothetical protein C4617_04300 [Candidatus Liberibacter europaeus]
MLIFLPLMTKMHKFFLRCINKIMLVQIILVQCCIVPLSGCSNIHKNKTLSASNNSIVLSDSEIYASRPKLVVGDKKGDVSNINQENDLKIVVPQETPTNILSNFYLPDPPLEYYEL